MACTFVFSNRKSSVKMFFFCERSFLCRNFLKLVGLNTFFESTLIIFKKKIITFCWRILDPVVVAWIHIHQWFPTIFVCWHSKKAKQIFQHNSHINQFIWIASSIASDSFLEITFSDRITESLTLSTVTLWPHLVNFGWIIFGCNKY